MQINKDRKLYTISKLKFPKWLMWNRHLFGDYNFLKSIWNSNMEFLICNEETLCSQDEVTTISWPLVLPIQKLTKVWILLMKLMSLFLLLLISVTWPRALISEHAGLTPRPDSPVAGGSGPASSDQLTLGDTCSWGTWQTSSPHHLPSGGTGWAVACSEASC